MSNIFSGLSPRHGLAWTQGIMRLFSAGAVLFEAHRYFLRYYANEWAGIQFAGVNNCAGEESIANGDLIDQPITLCNEPLNFVPWVVLYERHWKAALAYYGLAAVLILIISLVIGALGRQTGSTAPFGKGQVLPPPPENEHLR